MWTSSFGYLLGYMGPLWKGKEKASGQNWGSFRDCGLTCSVLKVISILSGSCGSIIEASRCLQLCEDLQGLLRSWRC